MEKKHQSTDLFYMTIYGNLQYYAAYRVVEHDPTFHYDF